MDCLTAIHTRRSIRDYTAAPVTEAQVETLLRAAMAAPSAGNAQPWEFVVVRDAAMLQVVAEIHPYARMAPKAPLGVLVCGDVSREKYPGFWPQDCAAAVQNLLLAATALGLGTVWTGIYPVEERVAVFRARFRLPERLVPFCFIPVGHPREAKGPVDRFDESRIHAEGV
ncbi:nitroreductase family protein [Megalodesulfovibrio gigas]|uniref:Putative nitroreductase n=1 Tax=Megalodesulfovibrio gigas (strain ATCC 19364 / DSM 1382 / NCIMB 9332 / VKM B-1759) TaxID=1121448 RepID=T2GEQ6_MEGG1|nr:nitroreductase family protein [Megalodesulfovibrio gigas]AGW14591.1 putative nitroreductase [Megalodesulfovibrio gigas DSM 1382 = ATCC 19364]